jgi:uncharacterized membrane protein
MIERHASSSASPTVPPPNPPGLTPVLRRNIEALRERRQLELDSSTMQERLAHAITRFAGSMPFVYLHVLVFGLWITANVGWIPGIPAWDSSLVVLAMIASVEAIFLSTFVLISQNRMATAAEKRAELDLQINLLSEHEITKLVELVAEIAARMGVPAHEDREIEEAKRDVAPEVVLDTIDSDT